MGVIKGLMGVIRIEVVGFGVKSAIVYELHLPVHTMYSVSLATIAYSLRGG